MSYTLDKFLNKNLIESQMNQNVLETVEREAERRRLQSSLLQKRREKERQVLEKRKQDERRVAERKFLVSDEPDKDPLEAKFKKLR